MQLLGVTPNDITLVSVLDACANEACLTAGECIHIFLLNNRFEFSALVGNPLINMYNKCGDVQAAVKTFVTITERDLASWSTLMGAYAEHGRGKEAVQLMEQMMLERLSPDEACTTNFLSACSHCGQLDDGWYCFSLIVQLACITPDHYACVIDLFGRARLIPTAEVLINHMSMQPTLMSFMALLSACRYEGDISRSELLTEHVLELDAKNTAPYHMLNHISSLFDDGAKARLLLLNDAR
ncbi:hypothetical protein L7F22_069094 [Adiantum nelumboides]|nr:hypothetical protein [Adiantum nelumboides]